MWMLEWSKIYINVVKREKNIRICNVISRLVERKKNLKEVGDIYYGMELVTRKELKYVPWKNPLKFGLHNWWQILFVTKRLN